MAFNLRIKNAPSGSAYWFAEYQFYEPIPGYPVAAIQSGWLGIDQEWACPYGAYGTTDLHILVVNSAYSPLHDRYNLGPIYDGKSYEYDCGTGLLSEVAIPQPEFAGFAVIDYSKK